MTPTGEAPGSARLETAGDPGPIVSERGSLKSRLARASVRGFRENDPGSFSMPECWDVDIPALGHGERAGIVLAEPTNAGAGEAGLEAAPFRNDGAGIAGGFQAGTAGSFPGGGHEMAGLAAVLCAAVGA